MKTTINETTTDKQLVALLQKGNQEAFLEIVSRYTQKVHNLAMRITRNAEDTEEILQDVFVTVYKKISLFEGKSAFSSWLYRITANTAFMKLRKRKSAPVTSIEDFNSSVKESWMSNRTEESDINTICSKHELRDRLEQALMDLPEEYRLIFVLRDIDGLSNEEVSDVTKLTVPAVKSRLHRSRLMLRKKLFSFYSEYTNISTQQHKVVELELAA